MIFVYFLIAILSILIDQLTKLWLYGKSFSLISDFLWIESSFNQGAAGGIFSGARWFFIVVAILSSIVIVYLICSKRWKLSKVSKIALSLILGGAIGNLIDRILYAGVRDFIYLKFINFPIFNFADTFITIGGIMLVISMIVDMIKEFNKGKANDNI